MRVPGAACLACAFAIGAVPVPALGADAQVEGKVREHIEAIRSVRPTNDAGQLREFNQRLDDAWRYFEAHRDVAVPIVRETLSRELHGGNRNDLVLLDEGFFLYTHGDAADRAVAKSALFAMDPTAKVVRWSDRELFEFAHAVAGEADPRVLPWLDKVFLRGSITTYIPQHALKLDETLICVFLYGVHGADSEAHLVGMLSDRAVSRRALEVLGWLGSPDSVPAVEKLLRVARDYGTFARATSFLMKAGGPAGRRAMLDVKADELEPEARAYYEKIRPAVQSTSFEGFHGALEKVARSAPLDDAGVRARLAAMIANDGKDDHTSPLSIVDSHLPRAYLVERLRKVRAVTFRRLSDEALSDVEIDNVVLAALYYRSY